MHNVQKLLEYGQSVWLDYIRRRLLTDGELRRLVRDVGVRGVTSNPTIFAKAIAGSDDYDADLAEQIEQEPDRGPAELFEQLALADIRGAADILRSVFDESGGSDGFVSLEVAPELADDTEGTVREARRLWQAVDRPNLMIKVPATPAGIAAIETLIAEGINVNVTLIFSLRHYEAVVQAYLRGLERNPNPDSVASVASVFLSRIDAAVDRILAESQPDLVDQVRGRVAVALARRIYRRFREIFQGDTFSALRRRGARPQRVLWASTTPKDPALRDTWYVEQLVGPNTVTTLTPAVLHAVMDHAQIRGPTALEDPPEDRASLSLVEAQGIDLDGLCDRLQRQGVEAFDRSYQEVLERLADKRRDLLAGTGARVHFDLGPVAPRVRQRLEEWRQACVARRIWERDHTVWSPQPVPELTDRLGWLFLPEQMVERVAELNAFAQEIVSEGFRHVVLLGMGGSSLAPEVFARTFGSRPDYPELQVLDTTHPAAIRNLEQRIDLVSTLFLVSSKSGTTLETLSLFRYFWSRFETGTDDPGRHFVAITDPGTPLEGLARERGFRSVFAAPPEVGGRYSALSVFGLVPAALLGMDLDLLLHRAWSMAEATAFCVTESASPGLNLGAALGELARAGHDKVTFVASPELSAFPAWVEQLIAESTGKDGTGILPVVDEPPGSPEVYDRDRVFVYLGLVGKSDDSTAAWLQSLQDAGHPVLRFELRDLYDLGAEMFRWEMAVATAGAILGIHPFNQPDVQLSKEWTRKLLDRAEPVRVPESEVPSVKQQARELRAFLASVGERGYIALQAYLAPTADLTRVLQDLREFMRDHTRRVTTLGFGPRFLHSTGQLHKGGPPTGYFVQLVDQPIDDLVIPETGPTFGTLIRAQAEGDRQALKERGRQVLRLDLGTEPEQYLRELVRLLKSET